MPGEVFERRDLRGGKPVKLRVIGDDGCLDMGWEATSLLADNPRKAKRGIGGINPLEQYW